MHWSFFFMIMDFGEHNVIPELAEYKGIICIFSSSKLKRKKKLYKSQHLQKEEAVLFNQIWLKSEN